MDELAALSESPEYVAVMVCEPAESVVVNVAVLPEIVLIPSVVEPSVNVTVPVAVLGDTVAVRVTDWPKVEGFAEEEMVVVVVAWLTVCESMEDVLDKKLELLP